LLADRVRYVGPGEHAGEVGLPIDAVELAGSATLTQRISWLLHPRIGRRALLQLSATADSERPLSMFATEGLSAILSLRSTRGSKRKLLSLFRDKFAIIGTLEIVIDVDLMVPRFGVRLLRQMCRLADLLAVAVGIEFVDRK
jgi:hypothetical protein